LVDRRRFSASARTKHKEKSGAWNCSKMPDRDPGGLSAAFCDGLSGIAFANGFF
jgi:hypothetical protein